MLALSGTNKVYKKSSFLFKDNSPAMKFTSTEFSPLFKYFLAIIKCSFSCTTSILLPLTTTEFRFSFFSLKSKYKGCSIS